jgi:hypothetical protein
LLVVIAFVVTALLMTSAALAAELKYRPVPPDVYVVPPDRMNVTMDVLIDGTPARTVEHEGRLYLPVPRMGEEYEIRVSNHGPRRIAAIVSVDGLSVIDGRRATEASPGYLVGSHRSVVIKGWRRNRDTVAAFTFEDRFNSYAYRRGHRDDIGVIRLVAIEEMPHRTYPLAEFKGRPAEAKGGRAAVGGTGTGWGRDIGSSSVRVPFVRGWYSRSITIHYDTEDALRRAGVPLDMVYAISRTSRVTPLRRAGGSRPAGGAA